MKRSEFPLDCKIAKLKPLYKEFSKTDPEDYVLILLLLLLPKVIETVVHNQTEKFIKMKRILYKYQTEICKSFSMKSSLTFLTD